MPPRCQRMAMVDRRCFPIQVIRKQQRARLACVPLRIPQLIAPCFGITTLHVATNGLQDCGSSFIGNFLQRITLRNHNAHESPRRGHSPRRGAEGWLVLMDDHVIHATSFLVKKLLLGMFRIGLSSKNVGAWKTRTRRNKYLLAYQMVNFQCLI